MPINIFLSYCWKDEKYADDIEQYYRNSEIIIHRDKKDIRYWGSIEEFMNSIRNANFSILIISDNYLKSKNCMYEVLQVMKEKDCRKRIFPLVVSNHIYELGASIEYIKYWEEKFNNLAQERQNIHDENASDIDNQLREIKEISLSIGSFIKIVMDMNNPRIEDIFQAIDVTLQERGLINCSKTARNDNSTINYFQKIGISNFNVRKTFTDKERKDFLQKSYMTIIDNIMNLAIQFSKQNMDYVIEVEKVSKNETAIHVFYRGNTKTKFRVLLGSSFGEYSIAVSPNMTYGDSSEFVKIYTIETTERNMFFKGLLSHFSNVDNSDLMDTNAVTKEIWEDLIQAEL